MFDLTSSKLLLLGIVALLVVGPKDLPILLRTVGKYVGMIKRQAAEFRAQFDEAMRESELQALKKDVEGLGRDTESALRDASSSFEAEMSKAGHEVQGAMAAAETKPAEPDPFAHDANGIPLARASVTSESLAPVETATMAPASAPTSAPEKQPEKSGA